MATQKRYSFNVFYSHRSDPISLSFLVEDNNRVLLMPQNLSGNNSFGVRAGLNNLKPFQWWTSHINGSLTYKKFSWATLGKTLKMKWQHPCYISAINLHYHTAGMRKPSDFIVEKWLKDRPEWNLYGQYLSESAKTCAITNLVCIFTHMIYFIRTAPM